VVDIHYERNLGSGNDLVSVALETHRARDRDVDSTLGRVDGGDTPRDLAGPDLSIREEGLPGEPELIAVG